MRACACGVLVWNATPGVAITTGRTLFMEHLMLMVLGQLASYACQVNIAHQKKDDCHVQRDPLLGRPRECVSPHFRACSNGLPIEAKWCRHRMTWRWCFASSAALLQFTAGREAQVLQSAGTNTRIITLTVDHPVVVLHR